MKDIQRPDYLDWLFRFREKQIIKVVSGVRRCGKSTLFDHFKTALREEGVSEAQLISINFEDLDFEHLTNYRALYDYVSERLDPDKMNYLFLDEIQHCKQYERAVDSLFIKENCDVYITGSNAYFLSGELATLLSGRYVELKMLPLSFREFVSGLDDELSKLPPEDQFDLYLRESSFPYILRYESFGKDGRDYLQSLYDTVILKDVAKRLKIRDITALENVAKFMLHSIGSPISANNIANTLTAAGKKVDQKTVDKYIKGLSESLLLYPVSRYNLKGKQILKSNEKYYAVDIALRNMLVRGQDSDIGHILENVIFLELKRRGFEIFTGSLQSSEIDFVCTSDGETEYYQVAATVLDENTLRRELAPFDRISDNYPKYLITLDTVFKTADYNGVRKINAIDFLLGT